MLLTVAEIKQAAKITSTDYDTLLDVIRVRAQGVVEAYINRKLDKVGYYELYDGTGDRFLILDNVPLVSVDLVTDDIDRELLEYYSELDSDIVMADKGSGEIEFPDQLFTAGARNWYIEYQAGYADADMPKELKYVAIELAVKQFQDIRDARIGIATKNILNDNLSYDLPLSEIHKAMLNGWRKIPGRRGMTPTAAYTEP